MVYYTIPLQFALWLTIGAVEPSNDDNDDDSNGIINHEEYEEEEEDGVLVKDEPTPSRVAVSPRSESPDNDDQTHLDNVDHADHELHAADRADALDALAQVCLCPPADLHQQDERIRQGTGHDPMMVRMS